VSGAVFGTRLNFIIVADRIRRCLIASCCAGNVIARRMGGEGGFTDETLRDLCVNFRLSLTC
jgi:hypothetical protein